MKRLAAAGIVLAALGLLWTCDTSGLINAISLLNEGPVMYWLSTNGDGEESDWSRLFGASVSSIGSSIVERYARGATRIAAQDDGGLVVFTSGLGRFGSGMPYERIGQVGVDVEISGATADFRGFLVWAESKSLFFSSVQAALDFNKDTSPYIDPDYSYDDGVSPGIVLTAFSDEAIIGIAANIASIDGAPSGIVVLLESLTSEIRVFDVELETVVSTLPVASPAPDIEAVGSRFYWIDGDSLYWDSAADLAGAPSPEVAFQSESLDSSTIQSFAVAGRFDGGGADIVYLAVVGTDGTVRLFTSTAGEGVVEASYGSADSWPASGAVAFVGEQ